jgi:hypothetical protein
MKSRDPPCIEPGSIDVSRITSPSDFMGPRGQVPRSDRRRGTQRSSGQRPDRRSSDDPLDEPVFGSRDTTLIGKGPITRSAANSNSDIDLPYMRCSWPHNQFLVDLGEKFELDSQLSCWSAQLRFPRRTECVIGAPVWLPAVLAVSDQIFPNHANEEIDRTRIE